MSGEATGSTTRTAEQNAEVQKEPSKSSNEESAVEAETSVEQLQDNIETGSSGSAADDTSDEAVSDESTWPQSRLQDGVATGGTESPQGGASSSKEYSRDGAESQQSGASSGTESQQGGANSGTESQQGGASGSISRKPSLNASSVGLDCAESLQGCGSFKSSKFPSVVSVPIRQDSQDSSTGTSSTGDSRETALICDSNGQVSLESGVAGDISNSPDTQESRANGTASWEGMAVPVLPTTGAIPSGRPPTQAIDEREQAIEDLMSGYMMCFSKCASICDYLRPCSRWIRKSTIFKVIRVILLVLSVVVFALGASNRSRCPVNNELPNLMVLLGIAGIFVLVTSLALDRRSVDCPNVHRHVLTAVIVTVRLIFLGLFGAVLNSTYTVSPSFDPSDLENYCNMVFYSFAYYVNFVIAGIVILAFLIYVPTMTENADYELI